MSKAGTSAEILILEDPTDPLTALANHLTQDEGFWVERTSNPREVVKLLRKRHPDLILLDLTFLGEVGLRLLKRILSENEQVLIILISDNGREEDKVRGFEAGADDYLVKPFSDKAAVARISANLRRLRKASPSAHTKIIEEGDLWMDTKNFRAYVKGEPLELKVKEFQVLVALATHPGKLRLREGDLG